MERLQEVANCLMKGLKFTTDLPEVHHNLKCPMLDVQVWLEPRVEEGQVARVRHTFYEKPMASPLVFHSRSAYNWKAKVVTLSKEVKRRLMNMDRSNGKEERVNELKKFSQQQMHSS